MITSEQEPELWILRFENRMCSINLILKLIYTTHITDPSSNPAKVVRFHILKIINITPTSCKALSNLVFFAGLIHYNKCN